jgi:pimeloyl-ACP methyl ester carboxylesterase
MKIRAGFILALMVFIPGLSRAGTQPNSNHQVRLPVNSALDGATESTSPLRVRPDVPSVLLLHGFMSSPRQFQGIERNLQRDGYNPKNLEITDISDSGTPGLPVTTWELNSRKLFLDHMNPGEKTWVVAYSMGANLFLRVFLRDSRIRERTAGVILVAPFLIAHPQSAILEDVLSRVPPTLKEFSADKIMRLSQILVEEQLIQHPLDLRDWLGTKPIPISTLLEALKAQDYFVNFEVGASYSVPLVLIQSTNDQIIDHKFNTRFLRRVSSKFTVSEFTDPRQGHHLLNGDANLTSTLYQLITKALQNN